MATGDACNGCLTKQVDETCKYAIEFSKDDVGKVFFKGSNNSKQRVLSPFYPSHTYKYQYIYIYLLTSYTHMYMQIYS